MTKIEYNSEISGAVFNHLNICMDYLKNVNNILYNIHCPYGFRHSYDLNNLKGSVSNNKNAIYDYKDAINKCMDDIQKDELELLSKINKIEDIKVNNFDFEVMWR